MDLADIGHCSSGVASGLTEATDSWPDMSSKPL
jgi:hypothetical protein